MKKINYDELFPEVPKDFHARIEETVNNNLTDSNLISGTQFNRKRHVKVNKKKVVVLAFAATFVFGSTVFAATNIYRACMDKSGYQVQIAIDENNADKEQSAQNNGGSPKAAQQADKETFEGYDYIAVDLNYLPENVTWKEKDMKYSDISVDLMKLSGDAVVLNEKFIDIASEQHWENKSGYFLKRADDAAYNKAYLIFEDCDYIALLYCKNTLSDDEIAKVMENCQLRGTNDGELIGKQFVVAKTSVRDFEQAMVNNSTPVTQGRVTDKFDISALKGVGDTICDDDSGDKYTLNSYEIVETLDGYSLAENAFDPDYIADKNTNLNADGTLKDNHIQKIKRGDGVSTLNEVVAERDVKRYFLVVNLTANVERGPSMFGRFQNVGFLEYNREYEEGYSYKYSFRGDDGPIYNEICMDTGKSFYQCSAKQGDELTYTLVYIINEDDIGNTALTFRNNTYTAYEVSSFGIK